MFKKSFFILGLLVFAVLLVGKFSFAAEVEPYLQALLSQKAPTEVFSVLLDMSEQVDLEGLKRNFNRNSKSSHFRIERKH